ncbi:hypothetical protein [Nonomuraea sp. NPDC050643]|uniref:hypothetical protein n=1 Tax=Nonomuraea sp. NPDC050643 TaxID=3155660 RepID=UPI0033CE7B41
MNDIDDLLVDLEEQEGIDLTYDALVPRTAHVTEHRYRDPDGTVLLSVANDSKTPVDYLVLTAAGETLDRMAAFLKMRLPVASFEDLRSRARDRTESDHGALVRMAIAAEEPDQEPIALIRQACSRPRQRKDPPRVYGECGQLRRHAGNGLCSSCWQRHPTGPSFRAATSSAGSLNRPPG